MLAAQFNSFRDPFIILLGSVPLALVGAMIPVFLWKTSLNIYSQIGLITLVGLIAKNGILIVEFMNKLQEEGHSKLGSHPTRCGHPPAPRAHDVRGHRFFRPLDADLCHRPRRSFRP